MKHDRMREFTRKALLVLLVGTLLVAVAAVVIAAALNDLRHIAEANPAYVRAVGEADVLAAAADAVRADTRIASWAPVLTALALGGMIALDLLIAAGAVYAWRLALAAGKEAL